jgi:hypothetical protein
MATSLNISAAAGTLNWTLGNTSIRGTALTGNAGAASFVGNEPPLAADITSGTFTLNLGAATAQLVLRQPNGSDFYTYNGNGATPAGLQGVYAGNWTR